MTILSMTLNKCVADLTEYSKEVTPVDSQLFELNRAKAVLLLDSMLDRIESIVDILEEFEDNDDDSEDSDF